MEFRFLPKKGIAIFVTGLLKEFKVYGPVKKDGFLVYGEIASPSDLNLLHTPTPLSPKQYLFPPRETLLKFRNNNSENKTSIEPVTEAHDQVLFGIHPCDIHAIRLLDRVFAYGTPDSNYLKRRGKTLIIGIDCIPDKHCFCRSVNTMTVESGFDLFINDIGAGFVIEIGTQRGKELLSKYSKTRKATIREISKIADFKKKKMESFVASLNAEASTLPLIYSGSYNSLVGKDRQNLLWVRFLQSCLPYLLLL